MCQEVFPRSTFLLFLLSRGLTRARITLRHNSWNSYETDDDGHSIVNVVYYPPAISRKEPEWLDSADGPFFLEFDSTIRKLLKEIYTALHNDSRALAVMGICALIEHIMIEQVGDQGGVGSNVDRFIAGGYIAPKSEALFREHLIESGHAAMHRAYFPKPSDISALLDITESLIETIYVHPHRAKGARDSAAKAERESVVIGGARDRESACARRSVVGELYDAARRARCPLASQKGRQSGPRQTSLGGQEATPFEPIGIGGSSADDMAAFRAGYRIRA